MKTIHRVHPPVLWTLAGGLMLAPALAPTVYAETPSARTATVVKVALSEWRVALTPARVNPGPVSFEVTNSGSIPHAFEIEGGKIEKSTPQIPPGETARLALNLSTASYEAYCPIGKGSHKMLGMRSRLTVGQPGGTPSRGAADAGGTMGEAKEKAEYAQAYAAHGGMMDDDDDHDDAPSGPRKMTVVGGGPVIQILPGPFPFADSAMAIIRQRPASQQEELTRKAHRGLYSNRVAPIHGDISVLAIDRGATGDSVSGVANFTTTDGARWKLVMDRVQTRDIPFNPRFGGVIMGLYYHGATNVHTPLVPTIQSSLALWAVAHLYRNDELVTDNAMVHIMLLSRTRRPGDWALACWDCSDRPVKELQLQIMPPPHSPPFNSDGGALFVNWEESTGTSGRP